MKVGSIVRYSAAWIRSFGTHRTLGIAGMAGTVVELRRDDRPTLIACVRWGTRKNVEDVNADILEVVVE